MDKPEVQHTVPEVAATPDPFVQTGKPLTPEEDALAETQFPIVEKSLHYSVRNNLLVLANIIFPIIGPAIRKAIEEAMRKLVQSVNQSSQKSLSPQSLKWRAQAMLTGRPYGEILLKNAYLYRVEHIFLIHKETGLLFRQVSHRDAIEQNPDMISAMLSAIREFVKDSFRSNEPGDLQLIRMGTQSVLIEEGPWAIVAAVIHGEPPPELSDLLTEKIEIIHRDWQAELSDFNGDTTPFEDTDEVLVQCLLSQEKQAARQSDTESARQPWLTPFTTMLLLAGLLFTGMLGLRFYHGYHWRRYLTALEDAPGIVIVEHRRGLRHFKATLLVDELAGNPVSWAPNYKLKEKRLRIRQLPFVSSDHEITEARIRRLFRIPPEVAVDRSDSSLVIAGQAPWEWLEWFRQRGDLIESVVPVDLSGLYSQEEVIIGEIRSEVYATAFTFITGSNELYSEDSTRIQHLNQQLSWLDRISRKINKQWTLSVVGLTDSTSNLDRNIRSSLARARLFTGQWLPQNLTNIRLREFWTARRDSIAESTQQKDVIFTLTEDPTYD